MNGDGRTETLPGLSKGAGRLLKVLQTLGGGEVSEISQELLASHLDTSARTVRRWLGELRRAGALATRRRRRMSLRYELRPDTSPGRSKEGLERTPSGQEDGQEQIKDNVPRARASSVESVGIPVGEFMPPPPWDGCKWI